MKKFLITAVALLTATVFEASAMSTARARSEALFLTDKMAYELNLTDAQYEAVYEINFDYFDSLIGTSDILGIYWTRRANELGYVLTSWQYRRFLESEYFYRPVAYRNNTWYFPVYERYAYNHFYRPAPKVYITYRGDRPYHKEPHNNMHFAQNHHGKHNPAHKPDGKPHDKPAVKPDGNHHNGNVGKPVKPAGNGADKPARPQNGGGKVDKPAKPANGNGNGNAVKAPATGKPSAGNVNTGTRRTTANTPARATTTATNSSTARTSSAVRTAASSNSANARRR